MLLPYHSASSKILLVLSLITSIIIDKCTGHLDFDIFGCRQRWQIWHIFGASCHPRGVAQFSYLWWCTTIESFHFLIFSWRNPIHNLGIELFCCSSRGAIWIDCQRTSNSYIWLGQLFSGKGLHAWDHDDAMTLTDNWVDPLLISGLFGANVDIVHFIGISAYYRQQGYFHVLSSAGMSVSVSFVPLFTNRAPSCILPFSSAPVHLICSKTPTVCDAPPIWVIFHFFQQIWTPLWLSLCAVG